MRKCIKCGVELIVNENWLESSKKWSKYECRTCRNKQSTIYNNAHKEHIKKHWAKYYVDNHDRIKKMQRERHNGLMEILNKLKINGCAICGYNKNPCALDFHHVNPKDKKMIIDAGTIDNSNKRIADELNKCILLCANCHRVIHDKSRRFQTSTSADDV